MRQVELLIKPVSYDCVGEFVSLNINPLIRFSDNYFDLFPGEVKEIIIENATDEEIKRLSVEWNNK
ncbi:hypothetical protein KAV79_06705 [Candidatus Aerophobetes bacterium]|nr:hypothetical protein [Candidatus Aerophobetes bacterium]